MLVAPRLYDPSFEHDSCGFGLVAQIDGRASKWVVDTAFAALAKLSHRGGVNADGVTGDGCGVLIHHPQSWLRAMAEYTLEGRAGQITCPTLVCQAESDVRASQSQELYDALTCPKKLLAFTDAEGAGEHCEAGAGSLFDQRVYDWLDETLATRAG